ncbi:MAG TPA: sensor histidine kinase [Jatrophihabitans sp.]|nr:sensor histidine kinase [Jatrophihabitans sp.]
MVAVCPSDAEPAGYRHEALFYDDAATYLSATVPFIETGLAAGEPVLVVTSGERVGLIESAVAPNDLLAIADMATVGHNPGLIIAAWTDFVRTHTSSGRAVRGIGEPVYPERPPAELDACQLHEDLLNLAFDDTTPFWLMCPYDMANLPSHVIERARSSHPQLAASGERRVSTSYRLPNADTILDRPLPPAPDDVPALAFTVDMLANLRAYIGTFSTGAGLPAARAVDLVIAANEVTTNSLRHGGGAGELRLWAEPDRVVCEISDAGHIRSPLVGRFRPPPSATCGRGIWIANQLCDLVQIRSSPAGTTVRLHALR